MPSRFGLPKEDGSAGGSSRAKPEGVGTMDPGGAPPAAAAAAAAGQQAAATAALPLGPGLGVPPGAARELCEASWSYVLLSVRFRTNDVSTVRAA